MQMLPFNDCLLHWFSTILHLVIGENRKIISGSAKAEIKTIEYWFSTVGPWMRSGLLKVIVTIS